jgi:hypothetical protein
MHRIATFIACAAMLCTGAACTRKAQMGESPAVGSEKSAISNEQIKRHAFLQCMYEQNYFPKRLVDKGQKILLALCERIETEKPADEASLYGMTHAATNEFNELAEEFLDADSEIETGARECIASDFEFIAKTYGFVNADAEELIATRDW